MKTYLSVTLLAFFAAALAGCGDPPPRRDHETPTGERAVVMRIDGCEYVVFGRVGSGVAAVHKANCDNHANPTKP